MPASTPESRAIDLGFSKVAHAIRRSAALYVAMSILSADATVEDLKRQADELALWIGGSAAAAESDRAPWQPPTD